MLRISTAVDERLSGLSRRVGAAMVLDRFELLYGRPPQYVLDAGCGYGGMLEYFHAYGVKQCEGFDPSAEAIHQTLSSAHLRCWVGSADEKLTYDSLDAQPEVIVAHLTLGLWKNPHQALAHLIAVLATPGLIYLMDLSRDCSDLVAYGQNPGEKEYLRDQLSSSLTGAEFDELLTNVAESYQWDVGSGLLGGFEPSEPRGRELLQSPRTSRVLRDLVHLGEMPPPPGAFITAWIRKGGDTHVSSHSWGPHRDTPRPSRGRI